MAEWTIWTNVSITRRKSYFIVTDPDQATVFRNRHFWPCVEYLEHCDIRVYEIAPSEPAQSDNVEILFIDRNE